MSDKLPAKVSLFNKSTGQTRDAKNETEVTSLIRSGNYALTEGAEYRVSMPGGETEIYNAGTATDLIYDRGRYVSETTANKANEYKTYGNSPVIAGLAGIADYATFGLLPAAAGAVNDDFKKSFTNYERFNSGAYHGTGITASIAQAILSGGTSSMASAAAKGTQLARGSSAAKAIYRSERAAGKTATEAMEALGKARGTLDAVQPSLAQTILTGKIATEGTEGLSALAKAGRYASQLNAPAISSRAGLKAQEVVSKWVSKQGIHSIVPGTGKTFAELAPLSAKLASGVSGQVAAGVVEGGLYGAGEGISEVALGDIDNAAEHILGTMTLNAVIGAAGGGLFGTAIPLVGKLTTGAMKASGGAYGWFAKSSASKAMTDSLARISAKLDNIDSPEEVQELMYLYRLDDVGKTARSGMMDLAKKIDGLGKSMSESAQETFLIEEILQQADKNGLSKQRVSQLMEGSNVPAIEVLTAFSSVIRKATNTAKDLTGVSSNNKDYLEDFLRTWGSAKQLDDAYGQAVPSRAKGQPPKIERQFFETKNKEYGPNEGMAKILSSSGLNKFFERLVDYHHVQQVGSKQATIDARGIISDSEKSLLDDFNSFINQNIEHYEGLKGLKQQERQDVISALINARSSGDMSQVDSVLTSIKNTQRREWTGRSIEKSGYINPNNKVNRAIDEPSQRRVDPVDTRKTDLSKEEKKRVKKLKKTLAHQEKVRRSIDDELADLESFNSDAVDESVLNAQWGEVTKRRIAINDKIQEAKDELAKLEPPVPSLKESPSINPYAVTGSRETLQEAYDYLNSKVGRFREIAPDGEGGKFESLSPYKGRKFIKESGYKYSPEQRNLLDKLMSKNDKHKLDVSFPDIELTPSQYRTLGRIEEAIEEGKTYVDETSLVNSRYIDEYEVLPYLTEKDIGLLRLIPKKKIPSTPSGHVRLYRAGPIAGKKVKPVPEWKTQREDYQQMMKASGRWFTDDLDEARWYLKNEYPDGELSYIDVPASSAEKYRVSGLKEIEGEDPKKFSRRPDVEFFIPQEIAANKKIFRETTAPRSIKGRILLSRWGATGSTQINPAIKAAKLKLFESPESLPRNEIVQKINTIRNQGDIEGLINLLNEDQVRGLSAKDLQVNIWNEVRKINDFFHESGMTDRLAGEGVADLETAARSFLKDKKVFGDKMARHKIIIDDERKNYTTLHKELSSMFGISRGTREYVDPDAVSSWIKSLKHRSAEHEIQRIKEHTQGGAKLLDQVLREFDTSNMEFKFSGMTQEMLRKMGITRVGTVPGKSRWKLGKRVIDSKQLLTIIKDKLDDSRSRLNADLNFATKETREALRWSTATANAANTRQLMRPQSFMGYFNGPLMGIAVNVAESISDPRLAIARLHGLETLAEQGRKELDLNIDRYITYLSDGKKFTARAPRSMLVAASSKRDYAGAKKSSERAKKEKLNAETYDEVKEFLLSLKSSSSQMDLFVSSALAPLEGSSPQTHEAMDKLLRQKIDYLYSTLPSSARSNMFDTSAAPSSMQLAKYARILEAVNDPIGALSWALTTGTLTREVVLAVEATSPLVFNQIRERVVLKLSDQEFSKSIKRQDKLMLSAFFKIPMVSNSLSNKLIKNMQSDAEGPQKKSGGNIDTSAHQTDIDRIGARR